MPKRKTSSTPYAGFIVAAILVLSILTVAIAQGFAEGTLNAIMGRAAEANPVNPADVLNLTNWKETLPVQNPSGSLCDDGTRTPLEIKQTALDTYSNNLYFHLNSTKDGVVFTAPVNGAHTCGSHYSRSELREMKNNGTANADWSSGSGKHFMEIEQAVLHLPVNKPHVVVGQIHDSGDDVVVFRLEGKRLYVNADDQWGVDYTLTDNYTLGTRFSVGFEVQNNKTTFFYNGQPVIRNGQPLTLNRSFSGAYFKAGSYAQASCTNKDPEKGTEDCSNSSNIPYAQVVIYNLQLCHNGVCEGAPATSPAPTLPATPTPTPRPTATPAPTTTPRPSSTPVTSSTPRPTATPSLVPSVLGKITGIIATSREDSEVRVTWNKYPGTRRYRVYVDKYGENKWVEKKSTTGTRVTIEDLKSNQVSFFRVKAFDSNGKEIAVSDIAAVKVK